MADEADLTTIEPSGDLVLEICQEEGGPQFEYRVDSQTLRQNSRYFDNLLSDRFSEGLFLSAALEALKQAGYTSPADAPVDALPRIPIVNIGRISKMSTIQNLAADFLRALHGQNLPAQPPITNLANLAVVADRFDALDHSARYMLRKKYLLAAEAKTKGKSNATLTEERVRQKLLVGLMFDHAPWVTKYSKHLIMRDSKQWKAGTEVDDTAALWWDIPNGVEDEMIQRREYILETINSLQSHFLKLYTSGERQCKRGYDSSVQCDSFQLGEMVRFFLRLSTVRLQGTIYDPSEPTHYSGDIDRLLESLRHVSAYQIDSNHVHCGLRVRIIPLLDLIQNQLSLDTGSLDIGLCADCWKNQREGCAWSLAKRPVMWNPTSKPLAGNRGSAAAFKNGHRRTPSSCLTRHVAVRDMFMAVERDWTARENVVGARSLFNQGEQLRIDRFLQ